MAADSVSIIRDFFRRWGESRAAMMASFDEFMTPDCTWWNVGVATTSGPIEAAALMDAFTQKIPFDTIRVDILAICADGDRVFTERVDYMLDAQGEQFAEVPVAGVFDLRGGRIASWLDYFPPMN